MTALSPGATIGIFGGGQLGRMLAVAGAPLGFKTHIYSDTHGPACDVAFRSTIGAYDDLPKIREFAGSVDVLTYEFENIPLSAAVEAGTIVDMLPGAASLEISQDRIREKTFLSSIGLPIAPFAPVDTLETLSRAVQEIATPAILKTARFGYDGKGQARIVEGATASDLTAAFSSVGQGPCVLERVISFECEISVLLVRGTNGEAVCYDVPINTHRDGILATSQVPAPLPEFVCARAQDMARRLGKALDHVGVLAVEMFYLGADTCEPLLINEFAPRVHNSGHWTLDACAVSQFENHIRAVAGWPLGSPERHSDAVMTNLIGADIDNWPKLCGEPQSCVHIYGKGETRPGRKMGHVTHLTPRSSD